MRTVHFPEGSILTLIVGGPIKVSKFKKKKQKKFGSHFKELVEGPPRRGIRGAMRVVFCKNENICIFLLGNRKLFWNIKKMQKFSFGTTLLALYCDF